MYRQSLAAAGAGLLALAALWAVVDELVGDGIYELGKSIFLPPPGFLSFLVLYFFFGTIAVVAFSAAIALHLGEGGRQQRLAGAWGRAHDGRWLLYACFFAAALPALVRTYFLDGLPLTDDESAYRFMAEVLAGGRLWADSPPLPLAFDNRFMVNDGRMYAQYFLGWPALLVPGALLGITGFVNCFFAALTVVPLYFLLRRAAGAAWARVGVALLLVSPMLMLLAATELSHTSCICALAWFSWWLLRAGDEDAGPRHHAGAAIAFCVAFWIRPLSAVGIGLPWLIYWAYKYVRPRRWREALAFVLPAAALAALFLAVNAWQNGSPFTVAYERYLEYSRANDFRFSIWPSEPRPQDQEMAWLGPWRSLAMNAAGLMRLNITLFGWVSSLLFMLFAGKGLTSRLFLASVVSFFLSHAAVGNVGIDAFAPMHFIELAWPVLVLSVLGLRRLTELAGRLPAAVRWRPVPLAVAVSMTLVAWSAYVPVRAEALDHMLENIRQPFDAVEAAEISRGVIFVNETWVPYCLHRPTRGWVFGRPNNRPDLSNDVIWANHLTVEINRSVAAWLDRPGFLLAWSGDCRPVLVPLESVQEGNYPDAKISGLDEVVLPGGYP